MELLLRHAPQLLLLYWYPSPPSTLNSTPFLCKDRHYRSALFLFYLRFCVRCLFCSKVNNLGEENNAISGVSRLERHSRSFLSKYPWPRAIFLKLRRSHRYYLIDRRETCIKVHARLFEDCLRYLDCSIMLRAK